MCKLWWGDLDGHDGQKHSGERSQAERSAGLPVEPGIYKGQRQVRVRAWLRGLRALFP